MAALHVTNDPSSIQQSYHGTEWYPNTAATAHITNSQQNLQTAQSYHGHDSVMVADDIFLPITHIGSVPLQTNSGSSGISERCISLSEYSQISTLSFKPHC